MAAKEKQDRLDWWAGIAMGELFTWPLRVTDDRMAELAYTAAEAMEAERAKRYGK